MVRLAVREPNETEREIEVLLDTGFNGFLALPTSLIDDLALLPLGREQITLASGETQLTRKYEGTVRFAGTTQPVEIVQAGAPLVGMGLLWEYDLYIQCIPNGSVAVESRSQGGE